MTKLQALKALPTLLFRLFSLGFRLHRIDVMVTVSNPRGSQYDIVWSEKLRKFYCSPMVSGNKIEAAKIQNAIDEATHHLKKLAEVNSSPWVLFRVTDGKATPLMRFSKHTDALHRANQMNAAHTGSSYGVFYLPADFTDIQQSA